MATTRTNTFIKIDFPATNLFVLGSVVSKNVKWLDAVGLTIPQARAYREAIETAVNFVSVKANINKPKRGNPAMVVDGDDDTFRKRLLLHSDDSLFVTIRREKKGYGIYTKPVLDVSGFTCDLASARQAASSIGKAIDEALKWR